MKWMLMPLRRYAEFSGRSRRKEYWMFTLALMLLYVLVGLVVFVFARDALMSGESPDDIGASFGGLGVAIIFGLVGLALVLPSLAVGVRRLHDIGYSGHWMWIAWGPWILSNIIERISLSIGMGFTLLALLGWLVLFILALLDGNRGPNRFGEDPKGANTAEVFS